MNLFEIWRANRRENIPDFKLMTTEQMSFWLGRFVMEAQKRDGTEYPPRSIYLILCGLLRYLKDNGVYDKDFLDENNGEFTDFRKLVDARMKSLIDKGYGCSLKQADPILPKDEETLWQKARVWKGKCRTVATHRFLLRMQSLWTKRIRRTPRLAV